jgi:tRNA pseudouridine55 synthase
LISPDGLILLNKPSGVTSFQSLGAVKKRFRGVKVGHAGTLDKFAQGLVLCLVGGFTRLNPFFTQMDKTYLAVITLGKETTTLDPEGDIVFQKKVPAVIDWEAVKTRFLGEQLQVPPVFSAVHVEGKRAYKRALQGETVQIEPRKIIIHSLELIDYTSPELTVRVRCSKGTYIRSLARDLGRFLDSCGYLSSLVRETIGSFHLDQAITPDTVSQPEVPLLTGRHVFDHIPGLIVWDVNPDYEKAVSQGVPLRDGFFVKPPEEDGTYVLFCGERMLGVAEFLKNQWKYRMVRPVLS